MKLTLLRPIVFFDIESTGTDPYTDRIVELAMVKVHPPNALGQSVRQDSYHRRIHPCQPIPAGATAVHGIRDEDLVDAPMFAGAVACEVALFIEGADFAGFGVRRFDIPMLGAELERAGIPFNFDTCAIVDAANIFHFKEPRTLGAAHEKYLGLPIEGAHGAMADTKASMAVLLAMYHHYEDLPADVASLAKIGTDPDAFDADGKLKWEGGELVINFGKMKGKTLKDLARVDRGYLSWMMKGTFSKKVITTVAEALRGNYPTRNTEA